MGHYLTMFAYDDKEEFLSLDTNLGPWDSSGRQTERGAAPENAFAWFNLGTSLTRLGEMTGKAAYYENGAAAFDQAFLLGLPPRLVWYQFRPYVAYMRFGRYHDMLDLAEVTLLTQ